MNIFIEMKPFDVLATFYAPAGFSKLPPTPTASGLQIRRAANRPVASDYQLQRERGPGEEPEFISDGQAVELHEGDQFCIVPPAQ